MAAQAQRIADLEQQIADLRRDFAATSAALEYAVAIGRASVLSPPAPQPRAPHLRLIAGGLDAREAEAELEAGA